MDAIKTLETHNFSEREIFPLLSLCSDAHWRDKIRVLSSSVPFMQSS